MLQEYWNDDDEMWESDWVWVLSPDTTHATLTAYSTALGSDGTHTVVVGVKNNTGTVATDSWTITTRIPPTLGTPTPAAGSVVATTMPTIAIAASDNTTVAAVSATINGLPATATFDRASSTVRITPKSPLANDAASTVALKVFDGVGAERDLTWTFSVQIYPEMLSSYNNASCVLCHPGYENDDDMAANCLNCHGGYELPHVGTPSSLHPAADVSGCSGCHVSSLSVEHARYKDTSGAALTCATCHTSTTPAVVAAIASHTTACAACHAGAGHVTQHATTLDAACTCHTPNLVTEHVDVRKLSCDTCHKSTDPAVSSAIARGDKSCTACHSTYSTDHYNSVDHTATPAPADIKVSRNRLRHALVLGVPLLKAR